MNRLLHDAAYNGLGNLVKLLLDRGANVHIQSIYKKTPLHKAVDPNADPQTVRLLLEHGSDVNTKGNHGSTLISSYTIEKKPLETFFLLLLFGADVNREHDYVKEKINNTPNLKSCLAAFEEIKAMPHLGRLIEANIKKEGAKAIASYIDNEAKGQKLIKEFKTIKEKYGSDEQLSFVPQYLFSLIKKIGLDYKISKEIGEKVISNFLEMQEVTGADDISAVIASDLNKNDIMNVAFSNEQSYKALKPLNKLMTELKDICKMPNTALAAAQSEAVPSQSRCCIS